MTHPDKSHDRCDPYLQTSHEPAPMPPATTHSSQPNVPLSTPTLGKKGWVPPPYPRTIPIEPHAAQTIQTPVWEKGARHSRAVHLPIQVPAPKQMSSKGAATRTLLSPGVPISTMSSDQLKRKECSPHIFPTHTHNPAPGWPGRPQMTVTNPVAGLALPAYPESENTLSDPKQWHEPLLPTKSRQRPLEQEGHAAGRLAGPVDTTFQTHDFFNPPPGLRARAEKYFRYTQLERDRTLWYLREDPDSLRTSLKIWLCAMFEEGPCSMHRVNILLYCQRAIKTPEFTSLMGGGSTGLLRAVVKCAGRFPCTRLQKLNPDLLANQVGEGGAEVTGNKAETVRVESEATPNPYAVFSARGPPKKWTEFVPGKPGGKENRQQQTRGQGK